ncbi:MAG: sigma-70 family RNA polymerase sigma factor [Alphaproteobacteria bacterium]
MAFSGGKNRFAEDGEWSELAALSQSGDKRAYAKLLALLYPYIRKILAGGLANNDWLEDITQDVLISVHKSLHTYSPDRPFKPWIKAIIQFRKTDFLRTHYRKQNIAADVKVENNVFDEDVTYQPNYDELKDISAAISSFPEKQQQIFKLMKIEGYTAKEVAEQMDMSESAVKVSAHRTTAKLKKKLG